jgi:hypothetical protein
MKTTKIVTIALAVLFAFSSCEKSDITVNLKQSGKLKVQIKNKNNEAIKDLKVKLYSSATTSSGVTSSMLDFKVTDENGNVEFGELLQSTYYVVAKDAKVGNVKYYISKPVQVVTGMSDVTIINPEDFVGKLTVKVNMDNYLTGSSSSNLPVKQVNVALIPSEDYVDTMTYEQALSKSITSAKTDDLGSAVFEKIPSNYYYVPFVYYSDTAYTWASNGSSISIGVAGDDTYSINVSSVKIMNIKTSVNLTLNYYSGTTTKTINAANVIAVDYNTYNNYGLVNASVASVRAKRFAEGTTNSSGKVSFRLGRNMSYYFLVYYSDTKKTWVSNSSFYVSGSTTLNQTVSVNDYASLGLTK